MVTVSLDALIAVGAFLVLALGTGLLTAVVRRYAVARSILDLPNERSSHTRPRPRGGGLAIAAIVLGATTTAWLLGILPRHVVLALGGGALVAAVGWADDRVQLSAALRAVVHFVAAVWAVLWLGGLPHLDLGLVEIRLGTVGFPVAVVGTVWLINLYNFMDGIDGIAAGEGLTVALFGGLLLFASGSRGLGLLALAVAAACTGFLPWNWQPARIFMGDAGSGLLGFVFAVLAIASENGGALPALVWVILLGVFVFDATATLLRRLWRRERWYQAHRSHAYQRAVRSGISHARVSTFVVVLNGGLAALAAIAWSRPVLLPGVAAAALAMLLWVYWRCERLQPMEQPMERSSPGGAGDAPADSRPQAIREPEAGGRRGASAP